MDWVGIIGIIMLIIILLLVIGMYVGSKMIMGGFTERLTGGHQPKHIVIDGLNVMYHITGARGHIDEKSYYPLVRQISEMALANYPGTCIHIVTKNFKQQTRDAVEREMTAISLAYPTIQYYVAYSTDDIDGPHHLHARDDYLARHLAISLGCAIISDDKFRDSARFGSIPPFESLMYYAGALRTTHQIVPRL